MFYVSLGEVKWSKASSSSINCKGGVPYIVGTDVILGGVKNYSSLMFQLLKRIYIHNYTKNMRKMIVMYILVHSLLTENY